jgi:hypothetical protein
MNNKIAFPNEFTRENFLSFFNDEMFFNKPIIYQEFTYYINMPVEIPKIFIKDIRISNGSYVIFDAFVHDLYIKSFYKFEVMGPIDGFNDIFGDYTKYYLGRFPDLNREFSSEHLILKELP